MTSRKIHYESDISRFITDVVKLKNGKEVYCDRIVEAKYRQSLLAEILVKKVYSY